MPLQDTDPTPSFGGFGLRPPVGGLGGLWLGGSVQRAGAHGALAAELRQPAQEGGQPVLAPGEVLAPHLLTAHVDPVGRKAGPLYGSVGRRSSSYQVLQIGGEGGGGGVQSVDFAVIDPHVLAPAGGRVHQQGEDARPDAGSHILGRILALVPREIGPEVQLPEPVRETAALAEEASEAAGATPTDAEGHFLRGNAIYLRSERLEGEAIVRALTDAVEAYDQALEVYTREALPQDWAAALNNKGSALSTLGERLEGEAGAKALADAVETYDQALEVHTREALPQDWAMTLNNKGNVLKALGERLEGEAGAKALGDAVEAYDQALEVRTREALPQGWAMTLNNKGNALEALGERLEGEAGAKAFGDAVEAYDLALEVYTEKHYPFHHGVVRRNREATQLVLEEKSR